MNIEEFRDYCLSLKGVTEGFPFDNKTLVFKVMNKMFALTSIEEFRSVNLKCDPELAIELREQFMAVQPGYHMSKKHWNTITVNDDVNDPKLIELTKMSYDLVVSGLTKKLKEELKGKG